MNPKKLHKIPKAQKNLSKSETNPPNISTFHSFTFNPLVLKFSQFPPNPGPKNKAGCEKNTNSGCMNFQHINTKLLKRNIRFFKRKSKKSFMVILQ